MIETLNCTSQFTNKILDHIDEILHIVNEVKLPHEEYSIPKMFHDVGGEHFYEDFGLKELMCEKSLYDECRLEYEDTLDELYETNEDEYYDYLDHLDVYISCGKSFEPINDDCDTSNMNFKQLIEHDAKLPNAEHTYFEILTLISDRVNEYHKRAEDVSNAVIDLCCEMTKYIEDNVNMIDIYELSHEEDIEIHNYALRIKIIDLHTKILSKTRIYNDINVMLYVMSHDCAIENNDLIYELSDNRYYVYMTKDIPDDMTHCVHDDLEDICTEFEREVLDRNIYTS